jgi:hypothetical protein
MTDDSEQLEPGRAAFNRGEYFLAHELWEEVWRQVADADRRLYVQGLIQIAAGLHHLQQRRAEPAARLLRKGLEKLSRPLERWPEGESSGDRLGGARLAGQVTRLLLDLEAPRAAGTEATEATAAADFRHLKL